MTDQILTTIPFSGFYESIHSQEIDHCLERIFEDDHGCWPDSLREHLGDVWQHIDYRAVDEAYAKEYCSALSETIGLTLHFDELNSPREYNFTTDRIFAYMERQDVTRMFLAIDIEQLEKRIKERFTSHDGFISGYPNRLEDWPDEIEQWDHNQIGTALLVFVDQWAQDERADDFDQWAEYDLVNGDCSGWIDNLLFEHSDKHFHKLANVAYYLTHVRAHRPPLRMRDLNLPVEKLPLFGGPLDT